MAITIHQLSENSWGYWGEDNTSFIIRKFNNEYEDGRLIRRKGYNVEIRYYDSNNNRQYMDYETKTLSEAKRRAVASYNEIQTTYHNSRGTGGTSTSGT